MHQNVRDFFYYYFVFFCLPLCSFWLGTGFDMVHFPHSLIGCTHSSFYSLKGLFEVWTVFRSHKEICKMKNYCFEHLKWEIFIYFLIFVKRISTSCTCESFPLHPGSENIHPMTQKDNPSFILNLHWSDIWTLSD